MACLFFRLLMPISGSVHDLTFTALFQALQEQQVLARFDELMARMAEQNAGASEDQVAADVAAARTELDR